MFHAKEILPTDEITTRHTRCRELLRRHTPTAGGLLVFSRTSIYYLTGTMGNGVLWLPAEGAPVLMVRKGLERCVLESPLTHISAYRSYGDIAALCAGAGSPLSPVLAAQMDALPWDKANILQDKLTGHTFVPGDRILQETRAVKTPWELKKLRHAAQTHAAALYAELPTHLHAGQSEAHIARLWWDIALQKGHMGMARMESFGEETFLGKVAAGTTSLYAQPFQGVTGNEGIHPATPFGGSSRNIWGKGQLLHLDTNFVYEGYHSDMSTVFWSGAMSALPPECVAAQACCARIRQELAQALHPGAHTAQLWRTAVVIAAAAGFEDTFMGKGEKKIDSVGHGIGLAQAEWPYLSEAEDAVLQEGMVLVLEPKISTAHGMLGTRAVYAVTAEVGQALADTPDTVICLPE